MTGSAAEWADIIIQPRAGRAARTVMFIFSLRFRGLSLKAVGLVAE